jgi:hypothetical protein
MRRVDLVRIDVEEGHVVCVAIGAGNRLPCARRIALSTARELQRGGVPVVFARSA